MEEIIKCGNNLEPNEPIEELNDISRISELSQELAKTNDELLRAREKITRLEKLYTTTHSYTLELRRQLQVLTEQLQAQGNSQNNNLTERPDVLDACTQYNEEDTKLLGFDESIEDAETFATTTVDNDAINDATQNVSAIVDWTIGIDDGLSIADSLRQTAEAVVNLSGFVFDPATWMYYDCQSGYYYDADKSMYYEPQYGAYYQYNQENQEYVFDSYIDRTKFQTLYHIIYNRSAEQIGNKEKKLKRKSRKAAENSGNAERDDIDPVVEEFRKISLAHSRSKKDILAQISSLVESGSDDNSSETAEELEDGELSDSDAEEAMEVHVSMVPIQELTQGPPCIRAMVKSSDCLPAGKLFILTCTGSTIGRQVDIGHSILIPSQDINKMHCDVQYNPDLQRYVVKDFASQSGTFVNGRRLSKAKVMSDPKVLYHGDLLRLGSNTEFELHIHPRSNTCNGCEPGLLLPVIHKDTTNEGLKVETKQDKETSRRRQLKQIKKKFGLQNMAYEIGPTSTDTGHEDKAAVRRLKHGSDNPYQRDEPPASVHRAIASDNVGHKMLAKLGWREGQSLGKSQHGIVEPIAAEQRLIPTAGLGSFASKLQLSRDNNSETSHSRNWAMARERYNQLQTTDAWNKDDSVDVVKGIEFNTQDQGIEPETSVSLSSSQRTVTQTKINWLKSKKPFLAGDSVLEPCSDGD